MLDTSSFSRRTICFPYMNDHILLGMKLEGFGSGKYNGFGGKFDVKKGDKIIEDAAVRELLEESCLEADIIDMEKRAVIDFVFHVKPAYNQRVHVYFLNKWEGIPRRTKEMNPEWFANADIPYDKMWDSDKLWFPDLLHGKKLHAIFYWKNDNETVDSYKLSYDVKLDEW